MSDFSLRARGVLWWLLPLLALAALIGWETDWGRAVDKHPAPAEEVAPKPVAVAVLPEYAIEGGVAARTETVERPLFNPTRRPAPPPAQAGTARMQRGQFALTGTTVVEGKSTAFLREIAGNKSRRVQAGESINGMLVAEVKPDRVRLALGDESEELVLKVATNPRATVQPVAAAPPVAPQPPGAAAPASVTPTGAAAAADAATLAERRRAARAAAAATPQAPPAAAPATPVPPAGVDPRWEQMDQRYRERAVGAANRGVAQ